MSGGAVMEWQEPGEPDCKSDSESTDLVRLREENARLRAALAPFARYAEMRTLKPFIGLGDAIHVIHTGSEWEAEITLTHCLAARAALKAKP